MSFLIIGRKHGMSRIFQEDGTMVPITLVKCDENVVTQIKTSDKDGYDACVLGFEKLKRESKTRKYRVKKEFMYDPANSEYKIGDSINVSNFENVETVSVVGVGKGKGFQGVIKRHNFSRGPETHGSDHHRAPGSVGGCQEPGRVVKGKKLPGRMGGKKVTLKNAPVVKIIPEDKIIAIKGCVPGAKNSLIQIIAE